MRALAIAIVDHYRRHRRALPWRQTRDPYAIWVSEIMLQQTRVETVIAYCTRWMERFPTLAALAAADRFLKLAAEYKKWKRRPEALWFAGWSAYLAREDALARRPEGDDAR